MFTFTFLCLTLTMKECNNTPAVLLYWNEQKENVKGMYVRSTLFDFIVYYTKKETE